MINMDKGMMSRYLYSFGSDENMTDIGLDNLDDYDYSEDYDANMLMREMSLIDTAILAGLDDDGNCDEGKVDTWLNSILTDKMLYDVYGKEGNISEYREVFTSGVKNRLAEYSMEEDTGKDLF